MGRHLAKRAIHLQKHCPPGHTSRKALAFLYQARLTWLSSMIAAGCVLPEHGGGSIAVAGSSGIAGTGGAIQQSTSNTTPTGGLSGFGGSSGTYGVFSTGGLTGSGGASAPSSGMAPGGSLGTGGSGNNNCQGGVSPSGLTSSCTCNGNCGGANAHSQCSSGWSNPDGSCATVTFAGCPIDYTPVPDYCDGTNSPCLFAIPPNKMLAFDVDFSSDAQITSLGAVVGEVSTTFQVALYSDLAGKPDAPKVTTSMDLTYTNSEESLASAVLIPAGTYWLIIRAGNGPESVYIEINKQGTQQTVYTDLADRISWPSGSTWAQTLNTFKPSAPAVSILPHIYAGHVTASATTSR